MGHVESTEKKNAYRFFGREEMKKTGHSKDLDLAGWMISVDLKEDRRTSPWIQLTHRSEKCWAVVNVVMNSKFHKIQGPS